MAKFAFPTETEREFSEILTWTCLPEPIETVPVPRAFSIGEPDIGPPDCTGGLEDELPGDLGFVSFVVFGNVVVVVEVVGVRDVVDVVKDTVDEEFPVGFFCGLGVVGVVVGTVAASAVPLIVAKAGAVPALVTVTVTVVATSEETPVTVIDEPLICRPALPVAVTS
jgi:hypothetical protein